MDEHFGDVLDEYIRNRNRTPGQLENLSKVPRQTIISWRNGLVKRPRSILDILRVAQALHLGRNEVNRLLCAARHYPIEQLAEQDHGKEGAAVAEVLDFWLKNSMPVPSTHDYTEPLQGTAGLHRRRAIIEISYYHLSAELQTILLLLPLFEEAENTDAPQDAYQQSAARLAEMDP